MDRVIEQIKKGVEERRDDILKFLREIVAIPSMDSQLKDVGDRIAAEMKKYAKTFEGSCYRIDRRQS